MTTTISDYSTFSNNSTTSPGLAWSCDSGPSPTAAHLLAMINAAGPSMQATMYIPIVLLLVMFAIFVDEMIFVFQNTSHWRRTNYTCWVLGLFPVMGLLCVMGIFMPKTSAVIEFTSSFYFVITMKKFFSLVLHYYGGKLEVEHALKSEKVVTANPFPCCFVCCCYNQPMTVSRVKALQVLVYQALIVFPISYFIQNLIATEGLLDTSRAANFGVKIVDWITTLSSFTCLYGFVVLNKASQYPLQEFHIRGKFLTIQMVIAFNTVQGFTIRTVDSFGAVACGFPYPDRKRAFLLHQYLLLCELFVLSIISHFVFKKSDEGCKVIVKEIATQHFSHKRNSISLYTKQTENGDGNANYEIPGDIKQADLEVACQWYENEGIENA